MIRFHVFARTLVLIVAILTSSVAYAAKPGIQLELLGSYTNGIFNQAAAEIVAHDPISQRLFVVNAAHSTIDVLDCSDPALPTFLFAIDVTPWGDQANSVDVHDGVIAAAVQADVKTDNGKVVFFNADGDFLNAVPAGALPDMLTYSPNGDWVLVANEGEPNSYNQADSVDLKVLLPSSTFELE